MMRTTPLRLMTLHFGQMGLTLARTFMALVLYVLERGDRRRPGGLGGSGGGRRTGEDPWTLIEDRDGVLEVCGHRAFSGYSRPLIIQFLYVRGPGVYHGFDGDDKARFHTFAIVGLPEIGDLGILVHLAAGSVADVLPDH